MRQDEKQYLTYAVENAVSVNKTVSTAKDDPANINIMIRKEPTEALDRCYKELDKFKVYVDIYSRTFKVTKYVFTSMSKRKLPTLLVTHDRTKNMTLVSACLEHPQSKELESLTVEEISEDNALNSTPPSAFRVGVSVTNADPTVVIVTEAMDNIKTIGFNDFQIDLNKTIFDLKSKNNIEEVH